MSRLPIVEYPDPGLRQTARAVTDFDEALARLAADMRETLQASSGLGLSAPQVGVGRRVLLLAGDEGEEPVCYVNPTILERSSTRLLVEESCLSLPGISANVKRAQSVRVRAQDLAGRPFEQRLRNLPAVCLQHELDHLDGRLFIDHLSSLRRFAIRSRLKQGRRGTDKSAAA